MVQTKFRRLPEYKGAWGIVVVKALGYKSVGPRIDSKRWHLEADISVCPRGKGGRCVRVTTLPPSHAESLVIWSLNRPEPYGPHRPVIGVALPFTRIQGNSKPYKHSPKSTENKTSSQWWLWYYEQNENHRKFHMIPAIWLIFIRGLCLFLVPDVTASMIRRRISGMFICNGGLKVDSLTWHHKLKTHARWAKRPGLASVIFFNTTSNPSLWLF